MPNLSEQSDTNEHKTQLPEADEIRHHDVKEIKEKKNQNLMEFPSLQAVARREEPNSIYKAKHWENGQTSLGKSSENTNLGKKISQKSYGNIPGENKTSGDIWESEQLELSPSWNRLGGMRRAYAHSNKAIQPGRKEPNLKKDRSNVIHIPPLFSNDPNAEENIKNNRHSMMQRLVLEEVKRVLELDEKPEQERKNVDGVCLASEYSLEMNLNSVTEGTDNFSLDSDYERQVENGDDPVGHFSVGSAFDRYGDAVVVLSPAVTRSNNNCELMAEHSISSSGMGGSFNDEANQSISASKKASGSRRKTRASKEGRGCFCPCKNCQMDEIGKHIYLVTQDDHFRYKLLPRFCY